MCVRSSAFVLSPVSTAMLLSEKPLLLTEPLFPPSVQWGGESGGRVLFRSRDCWETWIESLSLSPPYPTFILQRCGQPLGKAKGTLGA